MANASEGAVNAGGMLVEWFDLVPTAGDDALGPDLVNQIESGRPDFAARPGLIRKLLPVSMDQQTGHTSSGGSYLFDSLDNARAHLKWTQSIYRLDGLLFSEQPWVANMDGFVGQVVGAYDFKPLATSHSAQRIQVWRVTTDDALALASRAWPHLLQSARHANLSSVWLGVDTSKQTLGLVSVVSRSPNETGHDYRALHSLRDCAIVDKILPELQPQNAIVDKSMWVITIWLPPQNGRIPDGLWPNSPPLPAPL